MLVQLKGVTKSYSTEEGGLLPPVLKEIDLHIKRGEALAIAGPSGSGKSTLLNLIGALDTPTEGELFFNGRALAGLNAKELAHFRNRHVGFVFQKHHLLPQCTVLENVLIPALPRIKELNRQELKGRAVSLLEKVGMGDQQNKYPSQLSGGECQRVAVVRALINSPSLILADEPTGSLDNQKARELGGLLLELNRLDEVTLVVVTHSEALAKMMNRTLELFDGKLTGD